MKESIYTRDKATILAGARQYGPSWLQRGGVGAYMVAIRKWDRILVQVQRHEGDWFRAIEQDPRPEGIMDDIRDLRCYLTMIMAEDLHQHDAPHDTAPLAYLGYIAPAQELAILAAQTTINETLTTLMAMVEADAKSTGYDIFQALRTIVPLLPRLAQIVCSLERLDDERVARVPKEAVAPDPEQLVAVLLLANGMDLYVPAHQIIPDGYPMKGHTIMGDEFCFYSDRAVLGYLKLPYSRIREYE